MVAVGWFFLLSLALPPKALTCAVPLILRPVHPHSSSGNLNVIFTSGTPSSASCFLLSATVSGSQQHPGHLYLHSCRYSFITQLTLFLTSSSSYAALLCWPWVLVILHFPLVPVTSLFCLSPSPSHMHSVSLWLAFVPLLSPLQTSTSSGSPLAALCSRYKSQSSSNVRVCVDSCPTVSEMIPDAALYLPLTSTGTLKPLHILLSVDETGLKSKISPPTSHLIRSDHCSLFSSNRLQLLRSCFAPNKSSLVLPSNYIIELILN